MTNGERWARLVTAEHEQHTADGQSLLEDVVALGLSEIAPGVVGCSVTEAQRTGGRSTAVSNSLAAKLDQAQFDVDDGPCLAAARRQRRHQLDVIPEDARFSAFTRAAGQVGVLSSLSLPLSGVSTPTSLNVYAGQPAAFVTQRSQAVARLLARCAAAVLSPAGQNPTESPAGLDAALARRQLLLAAQQRVAVQAGISEVEAFTRLAKRSALKQCSIFEVAREVLKDEQREDA
jgi:hypothetical protein